MKITLPLKPVDCYEITYYSISYDRIDECRLVYRSRFVDDWQVFRGGRLESRICGWDNATRIMDGDCLPTRAEAAVALRAKLTGGAESYQS